MGKKVSNVKKKKKNTSKKKNSNKNVLIGIKEFDKENILLILLVIIFCVWGMLLLVRYNEYININKKIDKLDNLESEIKFLNNGYTDIENKVKKINDITNKNNELNKDIDNITKDIEELDNKISKYKK